MRKKLNKRCLRLIEAVMNKDPEKALKHLQKIVNANLAKQLKKADREIDLF